MTDRERLVDLLNDVHGMSIGAKADHLLDNGITFHKWIPVSERLPEKPGYVLACWKYIQEHEMYIDRLNYNGECFHWESFGLYGKHKVTHWMPLPNPPKEVDK